MRDIERESLVGWLEATIAKIDEMGRDDEPEKLRRAPNGRFLKKDSS